jgi:hypothetical protein
MNSYIGKDKQLFYINTKNRLTGTHSDFSYKLDIDVNIKYDKVVVLNIAIPKSFYSVISGYNTFLFTENSIPHTITLPIGNYTRRSIALILTSLLNTAGSYTYTITYENIATTEDTGKFTFTSSNTSNPISFTFTTGLYEQLGFDIGVYNFTSGVLISSNAINVNIETTLFLHSNICSNSGDAILQNIITSGDSDFSMIVWNNNNISEYSKILTIAKSNVYSFKLLNEDGIVMDTNGLNIVICIMVYKSNDIEDLIKSYIKYRLL